MKSVPAGTLFFKAMQEPPEGTASIGHLLPSNEFIAMSGDPKDPETWDTLGDFFKPPYRPGEKCLDKSTGKVATVLSCEPVRISEVTEQDAVKMGLFGSPITRDCKLPKFKRWWNEKHPGKEWAWRVEGKEEK